MRFCLIVCATLFSLTTSAAEPPEEPVRVNSLGAALDGYSPVSYFTEGKPELGDPAFSAIHNGISYWFTNAEQQAVFEADPESYVPAHGGWCTLMMGGSGRRTPGHPESWSIVDGRLMLFWSGDTEETKGMGMQNWLSKTKGTESGARSVVAAADKNWARFLQGDRQSRIFLYKESDKQAVTETQLAGARIQLIE
ncbi:MAG: hypothetical protein MI746_06125 [Pseudomonadales bacterium]|nr:hypothetical protein [Pseudomonadales bacterium]